MRYANLSRYDLAALESMLYSYERLAEIHARSGHYALAKWANGMRTHVTLELNKRQLDEQRTTIAQEPLFPNNSFR